MIMSDRAAGALRVASGVGRGVGARNSVLAMRPARTREGDRRAGRGGDPDVSARARVGKRPQRLGLAEGAVRTVLVEVLLVFGRHTDGVTLVKDEDPVQHLAPQAACEPFGDGVRPRRRDRRRQDLHAGGGDDGVEDPTELAVVIPDEEPDRPAGIIEVKHQVGGQLGQPLAGRMCGYPKDPDPAGAVLDDEEAVQAGKRRGLHVEQVAGEDRVRLRLQELCPGRPGPSRRRVQASRGQDPPHRRGPDPVAGPRQLSVDSPIAPDRVLRRQPHRQGTQPGRDRRSARRGGSPPPSHQPRCQPRTVSGVTSIRARRARDHRPVRPRQPRPPHLPAQNRQLMPQHQDLGILRRLRPSQQHHPAHQPAHDQIDQPQRHRRIMPDPTTGRSRRSARSRGSGHPHAHCRDAARPRESTGRPRSFISGQRLERPPSTTSRSSTPQSSTEQNSAKSSSLTLTGDSPDHSLESLPAEMCSPRASRMSRNCVAFQIPRDAAVQRNLHVTVTVCAILVS